MPTCLYLSSSAFAPLCPCYVPRTLVGEADNFACPFAEQRGVARWCNGLVHRIDYGRLNRSTVQNERQRRNGVLVHQGKHAPESGATKYMTFRFKAFDIFLSRELAKRNKAID
ncbi:hypothetical protein [uncultured Sphingomonas sp.]|uniref:hypothetical protein n=1 Tax=uncultured Sphingomonas sp. TaxID=158754 RepID=UPI0025CCD035|nr:hypothetical protein [uncultured Sphingomonas sp.]